MRRPWMRISKWVTIVEKNLVRCISCWYIHRKIFSFIINWLVKCADKRKRGTEASKVLLLCQFQVKTILTMRLCKRYQLNGGPTNPRDQNAILENPKQHLDSAKFYELYSFYPTMYNTQKIASFKRCCSKALIEILCCTFHSALISLIYCVFCTLHAVFLPYARDRPKTAAKWQQRRKTNRVSRVHVMNQHRHTIDIQIGKQVSISTGVWRRCQEEVNGHAWDAIRTFVNLEEDALGNRHTIYNVICEHISRSQHLKKVTRKEVENIEYHRRRITNLTQSNWLHTLSHSVWHRKCGRQNWNAN